MILALQEAQRFQNLLLGTKYQIVEGAILEEIDYVRECMKTAIDDIIAERIPCS